jgi:hypothetical protein
VTIAAARAAERFLLPDVDAMSKQAYAQKKLVERIAETLRAALA